MRSELLQRFALACALMALTSCHTPHLDLELSLACTGSGASAPTECSALSLGCVNFVQARMYEWTAAGALGNVLKTACVPTSELGPPATLCDLEQDAPIADLFDDLPIGKMVVFRITALQIGDPSTRCNDDLTTTGDGRVVFDGTSAPVKLEEKSSVVTLPISTCGMCAAEDMNPADGFENADGGFAPTRLDVWAGTPGGAGSLNGKGAASRFDSPTGVAVDPTGLAYVLDRQAATISKLDTSGNVTRVAGLPYRYSVIDGLFGTNQLSFPNMATYLNGKLYFTELQSNKVRAYDPSTGNVTTIGEHVVTGGSRPVGITTDGTTLYVAQSNNETIDALSLTSSMFEVLAGDGGMSGDVDGIGSTARFDGPNGIAWDANGANGDTLFVADYGNGVIRALSPTGSQTTVLVSGVYGQSCASDAVWCGPTGIAAAGKTLYVGDANNSTLSTLDLTQTYPLTPTVVAGSPGRSGFANGTGGVARFSSIAGIAYSTTTQSIYIADRSNSAVRLYNTSSQLVSTPAGSLSVYGNADGAGLTQALFHNPAGLVTTDAGVLVADSGNGIIRRVDASASVLTIANLNMTSGCGVAAGNASPTALAVASDGTIYAADSAHNDILKIDGAGKATVVCNAAKSAPLGQLASATNPYIGLTGIALDGDQDLYVADTGNNRIQHLHLDTSTVETVPLGSVPTGCSTGTGLATPYGIAVDPATHRLYVSSYGNCFIFSVAETGGAVSVVAGNGSGSQDGPGDVALFYHPGTITFAPDGTLYVSDLGNSTVRAINPHGDVSTIAGVVNQFGIGPGALRDQNDKLLATLNRANGIAFYPPVGLVISNGIENTLLVIH